MAPALQVLPHRSSASVSAKICACGSPFSSSIYKSFRALGTKRLQSGLKQQHVESLAYMKWMSWRRLAICRDQGIIRVSANFKAEEPLPPEMSMESALQILGVAEGAAFEEVLRAKSSLLSKHSGNSDFVIQVEAAYDVLLMQSLVQRRLGKVLDSSIRYADVQKTTAFSIVGGPQWFSEALSKVPIAVETPISIDVAMQSAVFAGLAIWTFASEVSSQPSLNAKSDVPGVILAVGVGTSIYFSRKQNANLWKAVILTTFGLVVGSVFGVAVESWLRVDLVPIFGVGSPAVVVTEFVLVSLWLSSLYLRL